MICNLRREKRKVALLVSLVLPLFSLSQISDAANFRGSIAQRGRRAPRAWLAQLCQVNSFDFTSCSVYATRILFSTLHPVRYPVIFRITFSPKEFQLLFDPVFLTIFLCTTMAPSASKKSAEIKPTSSRRHPLQRLDSPSKGFSGALHVSCRLETFNSCIMS